MLLQGVRMTGGRSCGNVVPIVEKPGGPIPGDWEILEKGVVKVGLERWGTFRQTGN